MTPDTLEERFWSAIADRPGDGCWVWPGAGMVSGGYGVFHYCGKSYRAHRVAWSLANGREVPEGLMVLHSCDNPPCVNPSHLRVGTLADNMRDVADRGRQKGERNPAHRLTLEQVDAIRQAHAAGATNVSQARQYGVHPSTISLIVNHKHWEA